MEFNKEEKKEERAIGAKTNKRDGTLAKTKTHTHSNTHSSSSIYYYVRYLSVVGVFRTPVGFLLFFFFSIFMFYL